MKTDPKEDVDLSVLGNIDSAESNFDVKGNTDTIDPVDGKVLMETIGPEQETADANFSLSGNSTSADDLSAETLDGLPIKSESKPDATQDFVVGNDHTLDFQLGSSKQPGASRVTIPKKIGDFVIQRVLGRGGMGIVYKAFHEKLKRTVALKMILSGTHASSDQLERFISEAKAVAHLQHPNIVQIFDIGEHENLPFFSLEFVDGDSLDKFLLGKPIPPGDAARLLETISRAMQYAHDHGILHRDLKPANVLLTSTGVPKITDFGLAKRLEDIDDSSSTRTGTIMGTPSYMSPEQASGNVRDLGPATDQYSLGAMLYEFMTGRPPFLAAKPIDTILQVISSEPVPPRQLFEKLPVDLETICLKSLQKDPEKRYASCAEFADDLARFYRGEPIIARPVSNAERAWRWCKRNPVLASLSATAALSVLVVAMVSTWSAVAMRSKNTELATVNETLNDTNLQLEQSVESLNSANSNLSQSNEDLKESNEEKLRRSKRLEEYVQSIFKQLNRINVIENPRMRSYKEKTLNATLPLIDELTRELPEGGQADPVKMSALSELADSYREQGMGPEAENAILKAVEIARRRVFVQEGSDASRSNLCLMLSRLSGIRSELQRNIQSSREALEEAIAINRGIISESKSAPNGLGKFPRYRSELSLADYLFALGVLNYRNGNSKHALELYDEATPMLDFVAKKLADESAFNDITDPAKIPKQPEEQELVATVTAKTENVQRGRAMALSRVGELASARSLMEVTLKRLESAYANDEKNPRLARELAGTEHFLGEILAFEGQRDQSLIHLRRAAELGKKTIEAYPDSRELSGSAATFFLSLAQSLQSNNKAEATLWAERSLKVRQDALKTDPTNDRRQLELMVTACNAGQIEKSKEIADKYMAYPSRDVEMLIEIAQAYSVCSTHVPVDQQASIQAKAIDAIQQACKLGFQDWIVLERDIDLAALRDSGAMDHFLKR